MKNFADSLSDKERRRARYYAYASSCFGCLSEVMIDNSAIIIIYISMLGGNEAEAMLSTSLSGILMMIMLIPCAYIASRIGLRKSFVTACITGCAGFLLMAAAPFFGTLQKAAVLVGCFIFCAQRSLYLATWYPLLDVFLRPQDRGRFFGTMRYSYMLFSGTLFYILGKLMGQTPPMLLMQLVIGCAGLALLAKMYCMGKLPENKNENTAKTNFRQSLAVSVTNGPLVSYSIYICMLSIAYTSLIPLTLLYLKEYVKLPAGEVQVFSTVGISGCIAGYFFYGFLQKCLCIKQLEILVHLIFLSAAFVLAFLDKNVYGFIFIAGAAYFMTSLAYSLFMCNNSSEILALARPGNKTMALAFSQTYQYTGVAISRFGTSLILGANLLAPTWLLGGLTVSNYQTLFLLYGVIALVSLVLFPSLPAIVPHHHDYYNP